MNLLATPSSLLRTRSFNRGFTLIECLVVIALIAVLVAILLPALATARQAAKGVQCLNNIRQCGIASMIYADDNRQAIAYYEWKNYQDWTWSSKLLDGQYLASSIDSDSNYTQDTLLATACPVLPVKEGLPVKYSSYGMTTRSRYLHVVEPTGPNTYQYRGYHIDRIEKPSSFILLADSIANSNAASAQYGHQRYGWGPRSADPVKAHARHLGDGANAFFFDGHAASSSPEQFRETYMVSDAAIVTAAFPFTMVVGLNSVENKTIN